MIAWRLHFTASKLRDPFREIASLSGVGRFTYVVGYQMIPLQPGFSLFTPTFKGVGSDFKLSDITVCDETGADYDPYYDVSLQKMDDSGAYLDIYSYCLDDGGWDGEDTFRIGESVCMNNVTGETVYLKVSGEVDLVNKNEIGTGFVLWGNSTPVAIKLSDVKVVDVNGDDFDPYYDVSVQKMDDQGAYLEIYSYCLDDGGWDNDCTLEPGESVCVNNVTGETVYFKLPRPVK